MEGTDNLQIKGCIQKLALRIIAFLSIFLLIFGISVIGLTWCITLGCIKPEPGWYGWLLGHNILIAITCVLLLGISLATILQLSRDE